MLAVPKVGSASPSNRTSGTRTHTELSPTSIQLAGRQTLVRLIRSRPQRQAQYLAWSVAPCAQAQLVVSVPKRLVRRAVDRNRVKRVVRAVWREWAPAMQAGSYVGYCRVRQWPRPAAGVPLTARAIGLLVRIESQQMLAALLKKAGPAPKSGSMPPVAP